MVERYLKSVRLTASDDTLFHNVFPAVVAHGRQLFAEDGDGDFEQLDHALHRLRTRLDAGRGHTGRARSRRRRMI